MATSRSLENTPSWALSAVCLFMISISLLLEHSLHLLIKWLKKKRGKQALIDAIEKLKSELMLLGFMSLILAATQNTISKICVPSKFADIMLPCRQTTPPIYSCPSAQGKTSLISEKGITQLHYFIFALAVMQIVYTTLTLALGRAKMRRWRAWEKETRTTEYQVANDPERFRLVRDTTFGRRHVTTCTKTSVLLWIKCFFRQFYSSVAKVDYLTLRHGFITAHFSTNINNFNFQEYINRALEDDFKAVFGISPLMWLFVVIFLLLDVYEWRVNLWIFCLQLLIVLVIGTKLQSIVAKMALEINNRTNVVKGTPLVHPNDNLFWFGRPRFVLILLHLTLFMNAFELAFFIWVSIQFGIKSCYHEHKAITVTRVILAIVVQVMCSYITLPLYALVTQMGSGFKRKVMEEQVGRVLKQWHEEVRERRKRQRQRQQDEEEEEKFQSPSLSPVRRGADKGKMIEQQPGTSRQIQLVSPF